MKFSTLAVAFFASTTLVSVHSKHSKHPKPDKSDRLKAVFNFEDLKATVQVQQNKGQKAANVAIWFVKIKHFNHNLCPSGKLNWHVHEYPGNGIRTVEEVDADPTFNAVACAGDVTGGHYDPTFACGGSSQNNNNGVCVFLRAQPQAPAGTGNVTAADSYASCSKDNQSSCEIGDQSKKLGKLITGRKGWKKFTDMWMTPIQKSLTGRSLVLHCCSADGLACGPRLACANLEASNTAAPTPSPRLPPTPSPIPAPTCPPPAPGTRAPTPLKGKVCGTGRRLEAGDYDISLAEALAAVKELGGDLKASATHKFALLSAKQCDRLAAFADEEEKEGHAQLSRRKLVELAGLEGARQLFAFFKGNTEGARVTNIFIRKMRSDDGTHLKLHKDTDTNILKVYLGGDFEGGESIGVNTESGLHVFPNTKGSGLVHGPLYIHGLKPHSGTKYVLYLAGLTFPGEVDLAEDI